jgi:hypothetical protein
MDVAKVDQDVAHVASVSEVFYKRLFKMFYLFQTYIAASGFMLQVFYLDVTYIFTHMLQLYVPNISSSLDVCCV